MVGFIGSLAGADAGFRRSAACSRRSKMIRVWADATVAEGSRGEGPSDVVVGAHKERLDDVLKFLAEDDKKENLQQEWENSDEYKAFMEKNKGIKLMRKEAVPCETAMDFFRYRAGKWKSWRISHHLAFRRDETGCSAVETTCLEREDERIVKLCEDHDVDPKLSEGGCYVTWLATMAWDQEGDNHQGSTTFALVPDLDNPRSGRLLRDRGYAEIVPVVGTYVLDEEDALNLITPYDGGEVVERFWYDGPDVVHRVSHVKRMGGFVNATVATELRDGHQAPDFEQNFAEALAFGSPEAAEQRLTVAKRQQRVQGMYGGRFAAQSGPPSARSAFGAKSAFGAPSPKSVFGTPSPKSAFGSPSPKSAFGSPSPKSAFNKDGSSEAKPTKDSDDVEK